jgi:lipopolysaccharide biosynthesis glycosyltransferase
MNRPVLTVVSNADEKFFPGLAVAVASAVTAGSGKFDYHFLILNGGLEAGSLEKLNATIGKIAAAKGFSAKLDALHVDQSRLAALPERRGSRMTYAKLVLPEILPHLDSIVYLDGDVLCFSGVESVHPPADETDHLLAGARDYFSVIAKDCPWLDQVPEDERQLPYINCGVMWMNLNGLREIDFTNRSIAARAAIGEARQGDQSVFNFLCRGRSCVLPESINHRTSIGSARPLCAGDLDLNLHYIGSPKPWLGPPKTSNWLAQRLWHQAYAAIFPESGQAPIPAPPHDEAVVRRKSWLYALTNPKRAAHYGCDLRSLGDPAGVVALAAKHWQRVLPP